MEKARKFDEGKPRHDLMPEASLDGIATVFGFGAEKYSEREWELGLPYGKIYAALRRHISSFWQGEDLDKETGKPHLWHAGCCILMLDEMTRTHPELDNRPHKFREPKTIPALECYPKPGLETYNVNA